MSEVVKRNMNEWALGVFEAAAKGVPNLDDYYPNVTDEVDRKVAAEQLMQALRPDYPKGHTQELKWIAAMVMCARCARNEERERHVAIVDKILIGLLGEDGAWSLIYELANKRDMIGYSW